jgi:tetratricopeptide (TPR) repeat protein
VQDNNDELPGNGPNGEPDGGANGEADGGAGGGNERSRADRSGARRLAAERSAERAAELFRRGRFADAESELRKAIAVDPSRGELHFNLGLTLEAAGRLDDALRAFRDAVQRIPRRAETRLAEGSVLCRLGRYDEAIAPLESATTLDRRCDPAWARLIEARAGVGKFEDAETSYYLAQQHLERMPLSFVAMGDLQLHRGGHERAAWCFREALRQAPELHRVRSKLGRALAQGGSVDAGLRMYLEELRLHPGDVQTLIECGDLFASQHRIGDAIEKYRRAVELAPTMALPRARLGLILLAVGRVRHARSELETAYALDPSAPLVRTTLAGILLAAPTEESADSDQPPADPASQQPLGSPNASRRSTIDTALRLVREDVAQRKDLLEPSAGDDLLQMCDLLVQCQAPQDAIELLERALAGRFGSLGAADAPLPSDLQLARRLMVLSFAFGQRRQGRGLARTIARLDASATAARDYNFTLDAIELGRLSLACGRLRKAMQTYPHDPALRSLRARLWWEVVSSPVKRVLKAITRG